MENTMEELANKDVVSVVVSTVVGGVIGSCATEVINETLEAMLPAPANLGIQVVRGIGTYALGGFVGLKVGEAVEADMKTMCGALLTVKSVFGEFDK